MGSKISTCTLELWSVSVGLGTIFAMALSFSSCSCISPPVCYLTICWFTQMSCHSFLSVLRSVGFWTSVTYYYYLKIVASTSTFSQIIVMWADLLTSCQLDHCTLWQLNRQLLYCEGSPARCLHAILLNTSSLRELHMYWCGQRHLHPLPWYPQSPGRRQSFVAPQWTSWWCYDHLGAARWQTHSLFTTKCSWIE